MHRKKPFTSIRRISHAGVPHKQRYRFDALDWVAAFFAIATPLYIAYLLIGN